MNDKEAQETQGAADAGWPEPKGVPNAAAEDIAAWRTAAARVREIAAERGWSKSEVAKRAAMPLPTFSLWLDGTYTGSYPSQTARVAKWLAAYEEGLSLDAQIRRGPDWVPTPTAKEIVETLLLAQMMPDMVFVTLGPGMSKTMTARHFAATRPSAFLVTMRPECSTSHAMMQELALRLDVAERDKARRDRAIGEKLRRNGRQTLLIVDEAQNLQDAAIDQLRHFYDLYEVGIALLGNNELYRRFGKGGDVKEGYGQIHRRFGKRLVRLKPLAADIDALIRAWGFEDPEVVKLLKAIGQKLGALGQITKTAQLASIYAAGDGTDIQASHIRRAWENRSGERSGEAAR